MNAPDPRAQTLARRLRAQAGACAQLDEPLYAGVLELAAADVEAGGPALDLLAPHAGEPAGDALALRFLAAARRLALAGEAPGLAGQLVPGASPDAAWRELRALVLDRPAELAAGVARPCQTNEPGRSAALLPGFLEVARLTRRPLRVLELGASAGLNLRWDRYRYESAALTWGDPRSPLRLVGMHLAAPRVRGRVEVVERAGCDTAPLDPADPADVEILRAFVWPSQPARSARLEAALEVARSVPAPVERASAAEWVAARLARPVPGVATVVFHSVFLQYVGTAVRGALEAAIDRAGKGAADDAPLAHLALEPAGGRFEVTLRLWPGGRRYRLGTAGPHGDGFTWSGEEIA